MKYKKLSLVILILFLFSTSVFAFSGGSVTFGDTGKPTCVLKELNVGRDEAGGFFIDPRCDCETEIDLTLINYNNSKNITFSTENTTMCYNYSQPIGIGFNPALEEDTLIQITGSIKNHTNCTNCELVTYYNYVLEKEEAKIPDNSFFFLFVVVGIISFVLTRKKRI